MTVIMFLVSALAAESFALARYSLNWGIAIAASIPMIATTIMSSIKVKPFCFFMINLQTCYLYLSHNGSAQVPALLLRCSPSSVNENHDRYHQRFIIDSKIAVSTDRANFIFWVTPAVSSRWGGASSKFQSWKQKNHR